MNRQSGSLLTVRAPKMRIPRPVNVRIALMPSGFRIPCWALFTETVASCTQASGGIGWCLVHSDGEVGVRILAGYVATGRNVASQTPLSERSGSTTRSHGKVESGVRGIELIAPGLHGGDSRVAHREPHSAEDR